MRFADAWHAVRIALHDNVEAGRIHSIIFAVGRGEGGTAPLSESFRCAGDKGNLIKELSTGEPCRVLDGAMQLDQK